CAPANAIPTDNDIFPNADNFDGLRFYRLRAQSPEAEKKHQLTSLSNSRLHFGASRHAYLERWLASHEVKFVIATFLQRYEIKLMDGQKRPGSIRFQHTPDPKSTGFISEKRI
ncbi:hypothetical protein DL98DRAFT_439409, partial [Cadophora sp. DSE1049]